MKNQSNLLWEIKWTARFYDYPPKVLVLGDTAEIASRKARRILKKDGQVNVRINQVSYLGDINAF